MLLRVCTCLGLLLAAHAPAFAASFCAATGVALQQAMTTASLNGQSDVIRIVRGTHTSNVQAPQDYQWQLDLMAESDLDQNLEISGGWNAGCTLQETLDPSQTVLDAQLFGPVLRAEVGFDFTGSLAIRNLSFSRGRAHATGQSAQYSIRVLAAIGATVYIENTLTVAGQSAVANVNLAEVLLSSAGILRMRNNIVHGNTLNTSGASAVRVSTTGNAVSFISNNTLFGNSVTTRESGLEVVGVATVSNNAIGGNTTTNGQNFQFYSPSPERLSLRNNHFQTHGFSGIPASETGTTIGDPQWTQVGSLMVPNASSPLRDSGLNAPSGGLLAIDFRGQTRIKNGTVDRGAVEADPPPALGPQIQASSPANNSTTWVFGAPGTTMSDALTFQVSGGTGAGTTQLSCTVTAGNATLTSNATQTIAVGGFAQPVQLSLPIGAGVSDSQILCIVSPQNGSSNGLNYLYRAASPTVFRDGFE